jgi:hypothetical protein
MAKFPSFILAVSFSLELGVASACSCLGSNSPAVELNGSGSVFSGEVTDISLSKHNQKEVTFDVDNT